MADLFTKVYAPEFDEIDDALLRHLPDILSGGGMRRVTGDVLRSFYSGEYLYLEMDGLQPAFFRERGAPKMRPKEYVSSQDVPREDEAGDIYGLMSFHGNEIDCDESQNAWQAWHDAADRAGLLKRGFYDSVMAMGVRSLISMRDLGMTYMTLRQDESVSVDAVEDGSGVTVYRGQVNGLKRLVDEGQFFYGPRASFQSMLEKGGFEKEAAASYLDRLAETSSAFSAAIPAGSSLRYSVDAETLLADDMPDYDMIYNIEKADALPIFAAGTFPMPEMPGHRARLRSDAKNEEVASPEP